MILLELEDFDALIEYAEALDDIEVTEVNFCPMFVYLIDWAYKRSKLDDGVLKSSPFQENYPKLLSNNISFPEFVFNVLDSKIIDTNFKSEIRDFISDYIEYDGYQDDLTKTFEITNLWFLRETFEKTEELYRNIDISYKNYTINKENYPDLIIFYDPEKLIKERELDDQENI